MNVVILMEDKMILTGPPTDNRTAEIPHASGILVPDGLDKKRKQYTVFLVEDDPDDQKFMLGTLQRSPYIYNVHCFTSGNQLIGHIARERYYGGGLIQHLPTMILLDIHIPGASGIDILQELKDHPLTMDIPVIIVTNDLSQESAAKAFELKANAYITKPIHLDRIHEVIDTGWGWPMKKQDPKPD